MSDRASQQFGNYRLVRSLGRGGFAEVYLGEHIHIQKQVAIKVLSTQMGTTDLDRFLREARTVASLQQPHIVQVFDFGIQEEIPFLVMDYAQGGTLRQRHPKGSRVCLDDVLSYVQQIGPALQYAHDHHVIHRDVKPENMLLGSQGEILLSDFGIAMTMATSTSQQSKTTAGTVAYMAPEQIMGKPCLASDQYALGVIVYEWLSGGQPFQGSFWEVCAQHLNAPVPSLREVNPEISREVERCIAKVLSKDPEKRFTRIQDFAMALQERSQLAISLFTSAPAQQASSEQLSDSSTDQDSPVLLDAPAETPITPEIGQYNTKVINDPLETPASPEIGQDDPTMLKAQPDVAPLANTDQDDPTYLKTEPATPTLLSADQDQPALLKEGLCPIDHMTAKLSLDSTIPPALPKQVKRRSKSRPSPIMVACSVLLTLLVSTYFLFPGLIGTAFAKLTSPIAAIVSHSMNTPTQQAIRQSTPKVQTTQLPTPPTILPTPPAKPPTPPTTLPTPPHILPTPPQTSPPPVQRTLSSIQTLSSTVNATGQGTTPAIQATGIVGVSNNTQNFLHLSAGTILDNNTGTVAQWLQISLDNAVDLNPNSSTTVSAHVVQPGAAGNVQDLQTSQDTFVAFQYNSSNSESTAIWTVWDYNGGFSGGADAQQYTFVLQSDIDNAATPLKSSTTQAADTNILQQLRSGEHLMGNPQCTSNVTSDHTANDRVSTVTVTVTTTCTATAST